MGLRKWTNNEIKYLKKHYPTESKYVIAEVLDRTPAAIENKAKNLKIGKKGYWYSEKDIRWLKRNYKVDNIEYCCEHFGISRTALIQLCHRHGIKSKRYLSDYEKNYLTCSQESTQDISKRFGRSYDSVKQARHVYGNTLIDANYDKLHLAEVQRITGRHHKTIMETWVKKRGLNANRIGERYIFFDQKELLLFLRDNQDLWDATKCEKWFFNGQKWFKEKHEADFKKMQQKRWGEFYNVV